VVWGLGGRGFIEAPVWYLAVLDLRIRSRQRWFFSLRNSLEWLICLLADSEHVGRAPHNIRRPAQTLRENLDCRFFIVFLDVFSHIVVVESESVLPRYRVANKKTKSLESGDDIVRCHPCLFGNLDDRWPFVGAGLTIFVLVSQEQTTKHSAPI
jgi:hypothetical protein